MKKILSMILVLNILITGIPDTCFAQETDNNIIVKNEQTNLASTLFISDLLRKINTTYSNKAADYLDNLNLGSENVFSFFEKYGKKSLIYTLLATSFICFNLVTSRARDFVYTMYMYDYFKDKFRDGVHFLDWMHPVKNVAVEESISRLNEGLSELKGQEKAKKEIRKIVYGIAHKKNQAVFNNETYSHGDIIYILGPSGVGKTFVSLRIAKALSNHEPFIISASEVDLQNKDTVIDQLFNFDNYSYGYGTGLKESKRLVKYLQYHKGGVVIINEYDKMWSPALDEVMRTIADQGIVNIRGQYIDCRGTTFIITSNECTKAITSGNQDKIKDTDDIDDGTGSRTDTVKHDKSFLNRVKKIVFDNLTEEDYESIIRTEYGEKFKDYWKNFANLDLDLEEVYKHVSKKAVAENNGSRVINSVMDGLNKELADFAVKHPKTPNLLTKLYVSYDENKDEFTLNTEKTLNSQMEDESLNNSYDSEENKISEQKESSSKHKLVEEKINIEQIMQQYKESPEIFPETSVMF